MTHDDAPPWREPTYPFQAHLGFEVEDWSEGKCRIVLALRPVLGNRQGLPHGGVQATLLDTAMGFSGCFTGSAERRQHAVTLSLTVNYIGVPAPNATQLIAEAEATGGGRSTYFARGRLRDDQGTLLAEASGAFRYRHPPKETN